MIKFKGVLPVYQTSGSTGADLRCTEQFTIEPGETKLVGTGLYIEDHQQTDRLSLDIQIRSRSSLAIKGLIVKNAPATIDVDYRDEIKVMLLNNSGVTQSITAGFRIAQLVVGAAFKLPEFGEKDATRTGGFGSTGEK